MTSGKKKGLELRRARLDPEGWITLANTSTGVCWAVAREDPDAFMLLPVPGTKQGMRWHERPYEVNA